MEMVAHIDHWIAFFLLAIIGGNMVKDAYHAEEPQEDSVDWKTMCVLAIATSIDAFAVGITLAVLDTNPLLAISLIGSTAFILSFIGVKIGNAFGNRYQKIAQIMGGIILLLLAVKIVLEHIVF